MARKKRVQAVDGKHATIDTNITGADFVAKFYTIILNESETGCALAFTSKNVLDIDKCRIQLGNQEVRMAEMKWAKSVDQEIFKAGFEFID